MFLSVKAKRKPESTPQKLNGSCIFMITFFVELEGKRYFDHLQLHEILTKILPSNNCILLCPKKSRNGLHKLNVVIASQGSDPTQCPIIQTFEKAKQEVAKDNIYLTFKVVPLYSPQTYLKTVMATTLSYEFLRPKFADVLERKRLSQINDFLCSLRAPKKAILLSEPHEHTTSSGK